MEAPLKRQEEIVRESISFTLSQGQHYQLVNPDETLSFVNNTHGTQDQQVTGDEEREADDQEAWYNEGCSANRSFLSRDVDDTPDKTQNTYHTDLDTVNLQSYINTCHDSSYEQLHNLMLNELV